MVRTLRPNRAVIGMLAAAAGNGYSHAGALASPNFSGEDSSE
jgi:hypothetical protein